MNNFYNFPMSSGTEIHPIVQTEARMMRYTRQNETVQVPASGMLYIEISRMIVIANKKDVYSENADSKIVATIIADDGSALDATSPIYKQVDRNMLKLLFDLLENRMHHKCAWCLQYVGHKMDEKQKVPIIKQRNIKSQSSPPPQCPNPEPYNDPRYWITQSVLYVF
jgi:hypothetical protein